MSAGGGPGRDPGEAQLERYLHALREDPPRGGQELARRVTRAARWQGAVRAPLQAVATLAGGLFDGFAVLLGHRRGRRSR